MDQIKIMSTLCFPSYTNKSWGSRWSIWAH